MASRLPSQAEDRQSDISGELFGEEREAALHDLESEAQRLVAETSCNQDADCLAGETCEIEADRSRCR